MNRKQQKSGRLLFLLALGVFVLVLEALPLFAEKIPLDQVHISTPVYAPADSFKPLLGRYSYEVSWNGIPAGSVELELELNGDEYEIKTSARTAKGIDILYKLRYEAETVLAADTLQPKHSFSVTRTNSKKKITELEFLPGGEILSTREDNHGKLRTLKFDSDNFTLEPYSAGFLALSQEWKVGETRRFDMFSGKSRYLIEFTAVEQTEITVNGALRQAIVLCPSVKKLTDTGDDAEDKKLREARIYISVDQPREILKISSDLLFGSVDTMMVGFSPTSKPAFKAANQKKIAAIDMKNRPLHEVVSVDFFSPAVFPMILRRDPMMVLRPIAV